jgi:hypothetical protein
MAKYRATIEVVIEQHNFRNAHEAAWSASAFVLGARAVKASEVTAVRKLEEKEKP